MGLHQARSAPEGIGPEEAQERLKVFTSLHLRDKSYSILRGSICWLPNVDCSLSSELGGNGPTESRFAIRIQLAKLQDEGYRLFHSVDSSRRSSAKYKSALLRIEQGLGQCASANELFNSSFANSRDIDLQLEFLATRICVFRKSPQPSHALQALNDSRASCLMVVISCGKHEPFMIEQLDEILLSKSPSKSLGRKTSGKTNKTNKTLSSESAKMNPIESVPSRFHTILDSFSISAIFLLVANVVWPSPVYSESKTEEDLDLIQRTCACYKELDARTQANNHTRKIGRIFEKLLEVINLIKNSQQLHSPHSAMQQSKNAHNVSNTSSFFGEQHRLPESANLPSPSPSSIPPLSWESFSNKNTSTTSTGSPSAGASPGLLTPMDSQYQAYDPLRPDLFFSHMQQQIMRPGSSNLPNTCEIDMNMDYCADPRLLSDFTATNHSMTF